ncbi:MAG TPA: TonB C-terminal domain-containing protein [Oligoflexia bacterium]|nr:TonB C-terminal domain-containing protein [Oligoflexia bacterium]
MATPPKRNIRRPGSSQDEFGRSLRLSAAVHAILLIGALLSTLVFRREPVMLSPSIRVDLVGLPDIKKKDLNLSEPGPDLSKIEKELEASKPAPAPEPAVEDKPEISLKKKDGKPKKEESRKESLSSAIERIKALAEIENDLKKNKKNTTQVKGNTVSKGNALTGTSAQDINAYAAGMQARLREHWNLPVWLAKQNLAARVVVFLDDRGYVANTVLAKSSGNTQYDEYVLKTVRMSQPFGPPPSDIQDDGVLLLFPL